MLFYAFKMAVAIASLCVNASDQICTQPDQKLIFFKSIWMHPQGSQGCQKISSQNIKNRVFRFELFSVHLPLWYCATAKTAGALHLNFQHGSFNLLVFTLEDFVQNCPLKCLFQLNRLIWRRLYFQTDSSNFLTSLCLGTACRPHKVGE